MTATRDQLKAEQVRLEKALRTERAQAAVERFGIPEHFTSLLVDLPEDQVGPAAQAIAAEITGHPATASSPRDQEGEGSPVGAVRGEASGEEGEPGEFPDPENIAALSAVTKSGPDGGQPVDAGPLTAKDRSTAAIKAAKNWTELEQAQAQMRR